MTERDGATVDVEPLGVDRELLENRQHLRGKGLVQLDDVHLLQGEARLLEHFPNGGHGADAESLWLDARDGERHETRERLETPLTRQVG